MRRYDVPYPIDDDYIDEQYALSFAQIWNLIYTPHLFLDSGHGIHYVNYNSLGDTPSFASEWYSGPGFYISSGTMYQAFNIRTGLQEVRADSIYCIGLRGGRWFEWRCEFEWDGDEYMLYGRTRQSGRLPGVWRNEATHEKILI